MTCKEYKDRALLKYITLYIGSAAIVMNRLLRKTSLRVMRKHLLISARPLSVRHQRVWRVAKSINVGIPVTAIEGRENVYPVSTKNVRLPTLKP